LATEIGICQATENFGGDNSQVEAAKFCENHNDEIASFGLVSVTRVEDAISSVLLLFKCYLPVFITLFLWLIVCVHVALFLVWLSKLGFSALFVFLAFVLPCFQFRVLL
jgi:hypothetical protein